MTICVLHLDTLCYIGFVFSCLTLYKFKDLLMRDVILKCININRDQIKKYVFIYYVMPSFYIILHVKLKKYVFIILCY